MGDFSWEHPSELSLPSRGLTGQAAPRSQVQEGEALALGEGSLSSEWSPLCSSLESHEQLKIITIPRPHYKPILQSLWVSLQGLERLEAPLDQNLSRAGPHSLP